jgi:hypothetical protein
MATPTTTVPAPIFALAQARAAGTRCFDALVAVRDEIARGFDNASEEAEYLASEEFLLAEKSQINVTVLELVAECRKAGLKYELAGACDTRFNGRTVPVVQH